MTDGSDRQAIGGGSAPATGSPEGHAKERPAPSEVGKPGAPGPVGDHAAAGHMDAHAAVSDDDHGHAEVRLGPIDWSAWGYAVIGVAAGLIVVLALWVATS